MCAAFTNWTSIFLLHCFLHILSKLLARPSTRILLAPSWAEGEPRSVMAMLNFFRVQRRGQDLALAAHHGGQRWLCPSPSQQLSVPMAMRAARLGHCYPPRPHHPPQSFLEKEEPTKSKGAQREIRFVPEDGTVHTAQINLNIESRAVQVRFRNSKWLHCCCFWHCICPITHNNSNNLYTFPPGAAFVLEGEFQKGAALCLWSVVPIPTMAASDADVPVPTLAAPSRCCCSRETTRKQRQHSHNAQHVSFVIKKL